jgi:hypothetical protein
MLQLSYDMTATLFARGCTRVALASVSASLYRTNEHDQAAGYYRCLQERGVRLDKNLVLEGPHRQTSLIEAAHSFGASNFQIITKVMLSESLPSLVRGVAITFVNLFGYTAMAGTVGAGGLGDIAIRYGYQRYMADVMLACIIICVVLVQVFQSFGDWLARAIDKRKH